MTRPGGASGQLCEQKSSRALCKRRGPPYRVSKSEDSISHPPGRRPLLSTCFMDIDGCAKDFSAREDRARPKTRWAILHNLEDVALDPGNARWEPLAIASPSDPTFSFHRKTIVPPPPPFSYQSDHDACPRRNAPPIAGPLAALLGCSKTQGALEGNKAYLLGMGSHYTITVHAARQCKTSYYETWRSRSQACQTTRIYVEQLIPLLCTLRGNVKPSYETWRSSRSQACQTTRTAVEQVILLTCTLRGNVKPATRLGVVGRRRAKQQ